MKKVLFLIVFNLVCIAVYAQIYVNSSGQVSIATTTPGSFKSLTIAGDAFVDSHVGAFGQAFSTKVYDKQACSYGLYSNYYGEDVFYVCGEGYLWCKLGGYFGSDLSMKEDIEEISSPLATILKLHGVRYRYKDDKETDKSKLDQRVGLIAQEVEKVIPGVVKEMKDGTKAIAYTDLIGVLIEAIKEQQAQIEELKKIIKE